MIYLLIILCIIILILSFISFGHIIIDLSLNDNLLTLIIRHTLYRKKIEIDLNKPKPHKENQKPAEKQSSFSDIKNRIFKKDSGIDFNEIQNIKNEYFSAYSEILDIVKSLLGRTKCKIKIPVLNISINYGTGNPAATGMIYGSFWSLIGILYPPLTRYFKIVYPTLDITPDFYQERFEIYIKSIIKVRAVHIINAGFSALLTYLKNKKKKDVKMNGR